MFNKKLICAVYVLLFLFCSNAIADNVTVNLSVVYKTVNFAGKNGQAIAVNNQIPAPTLHFKEGDHVTINVYNHLDIGTAIHWHGLIVPWNMDGVAGLTQPAIPPGGVFHYQFVLNQSGTYWYHAHAGMQEQQGLYGGIIIDPKRARYPVNKDFVMILSDWNNVDPESVMNNLKKDGDYYQSEFPLQASLLHFIKSYQQDSPSERQQLKQAYADMQIMRMSPYDISDVAYSAFLLNGHTEQNPWTSIVKVGDTIRLRFIDAGGSSIFHVKIPDYAMKLIQVDGQNIVPYSLNDFEIAPGETFDVLIKITHLSPAIIYAESIDQMGAAYGALVTQPQQMVNLSSVIPFPEPKPMMMNMSGMAMSGMNQSNMSGKTMPRMSNSSAMSSMNNNTIQSANNNAMDNMNMSNSSMTDINSAQSQMKNGNVLNDKNKLSQKNNLMSSMNNTQSVMNGMDNSNLSMNNMGMASQNNNSDQGLPMVSDTDTKYQNMKSMVQTNDPNKPYQIIKIKLYGYMGRYFWFINGVPEYKAKPILIEPGKRYRLIFINETMMHHPMHEHGHWFILRNGHGAYDPLLHTIDVPPNATMVADLDANANGGIWYFHCHNLYHMMTGMATEFIYPNTPTISQPQYSFSGMSYMHNMQDMNNSMDQNYIPALPVEQGRIYVSNFLDVNGNFGNFYQATFNALMGTDDDKLNLYTNEAEMRNDVVQNADMDIFYWHAISEFWAIKGGVNYVYRPADTPYLQPGVGIEGLMPYFIDTNIRAYAHDGSAKLDAEFTRDTQISNNFFIRAGIRSIMASKTVAEDQIGSGVNEMEYTLRPYYRVMPGLDIYAQYQHTNFYGPEREIMQGLNQSGYDNTYTVGFSVLF